MSFTEGGRKIQCDGDGCAQAVFLPIGLRSTLSRERQIADSQPDGWLFALRRERSMHYCPACKAKYLASVADWSGTRFSEAGPHDPE